MRANRRFATALIAASMSLLGAHIVDASWAVTTSDGGSTFATGSIAAPTGVTATTPSSMMVQLAWTPPAAAQQGTGTRIDRNVLGGAYSTLITVAPGSASSYSDSSPALVPTFVYCYKLTTVYQLWTAGPTTAVCATATT